MRLFVLITLLLSSQVSGTETPLEWRQEYNGVVAAIDTLMRVEGTGDWTELDRHRPALSLIVIGEPGRNRSTRSKWCWSLSSSSGFSRLATNTCGP